jgi:hypothetical protein
MREVERRAHTGPSAETRPPVPGVRDVTPAVSRMVALQRAAGNRATTRMLQRWDPGPLPGSDYPIPDSDAPSTPIEVTAIDDRSDPGEWWRIPRHTGPISAAVRTGEVYMTSVATMVANVLSEINAGTPTDDVIGTSNVAGYGAELGRLSGKFSPRGYVHLQHCEAGGNRALMTALAAIFGVPVVAGTGLHNPVYRANFGSYVKAYPDGRYETYSMGPFWNEGH